MSGNSKNKSDSRVEFVILSSRFKARASLVHILHVKQHALSHLRLSMINKAFQQLYIINKKSKTNISSKRLSENLEHASSCSRNNHNIPESARS